ncbi:pyridoxamine 5'-phosphate oxidase family protein [Ilumatobacter nonamiensis]|uniref:pyridoxamine 5'-phosphate oxidase family protein n=1 Tax=Ilumatobacter nonamiensis TaxID=467093 RepID=UPI000347D467|nr:pyridoxamine 5'-phosphate oxidase family protein [Ilumatobacter nonamiensis]
METPSRPRGGTTSIEKTDELSVDTCWELLRGADIGRLAVQLANGGVDIFPVNFAVDRNTVLLRTASGTKLDSLADAPSVAFEVDHFDWYEASAWSVVVKGDATLITDRNELFGLFNVDLASWQSGVKPYFVRIVPSATTGRRFAVHR